jgi:hypothetical protein
MKRRYHDDDDLLQDRAPAHLTRDVNRRQTSTSEAISVRRSRRPS